jgi:UMF1 family MFS transporter
MPFVDGNIFGISVPFIEGTGKTGAFVPTAILFALFSLPLFFFVQERRHHTRLPVDFSKAVQDLRQSLTDSRKYPGVRRFLIATFFTNDAANTVIVNIGVYCSLVLGFADAQITYFLIIATLTAVVGSFLFGILARNNSLKRLQLGINLGWVAGLFALLFVQGGWIVWILGCVVGIMLGGLWTTSRPYLAELVPDEEHGRFFGLFALAGRASAVVGPLLWTSVVLLFRPGSAIGSFVGETLSLSEEAAKQLPYQAGLASLALMMLLGYFLMRTLPETTPKDQSSHDMGRTAA